MSLTFAYGIPIFFLVPLHWYMSEVLHSPILSNDILCVITCSQYLPIITPFNFQGYIYVYQSNPPICYTEAIRLGKYKVFCYSSSPIPTLFRLVILQFLHEKLHIHPFVPYLHPTPTPFSVTLLLKHCVCTLHCFKHSLFRHAYSKFRHKEGGYSRLYTGSLFFASQWF